MRLNKKGWGQMKRTVGLLLIVAGVVIDVPFLPVLVPWKPKSMKRKNSTSLAKTTFFLRSWAVPARSRAKEKKNDEKLSDRRSRPAAAGQTTSHHLAHSSGAAHQFARCIRRTRKSSPWAQRVTRSWRSEFKGIDFRSQEGSGAGRARWITHTRRNNRSLNHGAVKAEFRYVSDEGTKRVSAKTFFASKKPIARKRKVFLSHPASRAYHSQIE